MTTLPADLKEKQFLVTDDYESMRIMLSDHLQQLGIKKIHFASSGSEAFQVIKKNLSGPQKVDFVLTDMLMENGSGIDLVKAIRSDLTLKDLPVLMITSMSEIEHMLNAVKAGVNDYIVKPWEIDDLAKKISDVYERCQKIKK